MHKENGSRSLTFVSNTLGKLPVLTKTFSLDYQNVKLTKGNEYFVNLVFTAKANYHPFVANGHVLAQEQFLLKALTADKAITNDTSNIAKLVVEKSKGTIAVKGTGFSIAFDKTTRQLTDYVYRGETLIKAGPMPEFWRTPVDNANPEVRGWLRKFSDKEAHYQFVNAKDTWKVKVKAKTIEKWQRESGCFRADKTS